MRNPTEGASMRKEYVASAMGGRHFIDFFLWTKGAQDRDDGKTWKTTDCWWFIPVKNLTLWLCFISSSCGQLKSGVILFQPTYIGDDTEQKIYLCRRTS